MDDFGFKARFINSTTQNNCSTVSTKDVTIHSFYACLNNNVQYFCETDDILYVINKFNSVDLEHTAQLNQDPKRGGKLHFILPQVSQDINIPKDSTNDIDSDMKDDVECVSYHERIVVESVFCARKYAIREIKKKVLQAEKTCAAYGLRHLQKKKSHIFDSELIGDDSYYVLFEKELNKAILESVAHCCVCINHNISAKNFQKILTELYPLLPCTALVWANKAYLFGAIDGNQRIGKSIAASARVGGSTNDKGSTITEIVDGIHINYSDNRKERLNLREENARLRARHRELDKRDQKYQENLQTQINELAAKYEENLKGQISKLEAKIEIYQQQLSSSKVENVLLRERLKNANNQIKLYEKEKENNKENIVKFNQQKEDVEKKYRKYNEKLLQLERKEEEVTEAHKEIEKNKESIVKLNQRKEDVEKKCREYNEKLLQLERKEQEANEARKEIENEKKKIEEDKKKILEEREKLESEKKQFENEIKRTQNEKTDVDSCRHAGLAERTFDLMIQFKKKNDEQKQMICLQRILLVLLACLVVLLDWLFVKKN